MKKILILFLSIFYAQILLAADKINVELSTDKATLDEQITAIVRIETDAEMEPTLSADPVNAEIISSEYQGATTSTIYANGELTTKREFIFAVLLKAKSLGRAGLTNIKAEMGGKVLNHNTVWFSVVQEKADVAPVFILAQPSKTQVFQNEAILVRYYLMFQVDIASFDIKEFPKLNNFVKRYLQEPGNRERVAYEGKQFVRQLLYSLVLFPEQAKVLKLDPMKIAVAYDADNRRDPFGFGSGRLVTKSLSSKAVDIEVLKLPVDKMPTGYTGLVGKHKFSLTMNKTKVLVNEPIEIKLKITGTGNLEGVDAPTIINDPNVESFEANSSFEIIDANTASKTFEYTFLPRKELSIPAQKIPLSYFNPETKEFETAEVDFPGLQVIGGAYQGNTSPSPSGGQVSPEVTSQKMVTKKIIIPDVPKYSGAIFESQNNKSIILNWINGFLFMGILLMITKMFYDSRAEWPWVSPSIYRTKLKTMAEVGPTYAALEDLMLEFPRIEENLSLKSKITQLNLPSKTKSNLGKLVEQLNQSYASGGKDAKSSLSWKNYKNDLCLLVQALESWNANKNEEKNEIS